MKEFWDKRVATLCDLWTFYGYCSVFQFHRCLKTKRSIAIRFQNIGILFSFICDVYVLEASDVQKEKEFNGLILL